MEITTHQNTDLWQFNLDVIHRKTKKVIWQPRIQCWYDDKVSIGEDLPGRYKGMSPVELYKALGVSNRCYMYGACFRHIYDPRISFECKVLSPVETLHIMHTPKGDLTQIYRTNTSNSGSYPSKWWITDEDEMKIHQWVLENSTWEWNQEAYDRIKEEWGFAGAPSAFFPRVNMQYLFHDVMGPEEGIFAVYDFPETVEKYFAALSEHQDRMAQVWNNCPIEIVNFGDNVHDGVLSPALFEKYVLPEYQHRNDLFHSHGKWTNAHWDGDVKSILKYVRATGLDGVEAVTPLPQGDVTLKEVKAAFGDDIFLMDGIAALLFDPNLYPIEDLEAQVNECLELFAVQLIMGISDEIASTGDIDRVIHVRDMVDAYNAHIIE